MQKAEVVATEIAALMVLLDQPIKRFGDLGEDYYAAISAQVAVLEAYMSEEEVEQIFNCNFAYEFEAAILCARWLESGDDGLLSLGWNFLLEQS